MRKPGFATSILLVLAGCGLIPGGTTYKVAAKEARATLLLTEPPLYLFGSVVAKAKVSRDGDGTVRWLLVDRAGTGMLSLVARTQEVDPGQTRVTVAVEPPPGGLHDRVAAGIEANPAIAKFYQAAMEEQIDATFEHRDFDMTAIQDEMIAAAVANIPNIKADMDKAASQSDSEDRARSEQAYSHQSQGDTEADADEPAYGAPMDSAAGSDY